MAGGRYKLASLHPAMAEYVGYLLDYCDAAGIDVTVSSGFRTESEQAALFSHGRTPAEVTGRVKKRGAGGAVTDAPPGYSAHNWGLAVDLESPRLAAVMDLARQMGFATVSWDPDHIEWPGWLQAVRSAGLLPPG